MPLLGRSDLEIFPLVLGGNTFGWTSDEETSFAVLDAFTAAGGTMVDSADGYSHWAPGNTGGESETVIGKWLKSRGSRDALQVATKVSTHPQFKGLAPDNIAKAADASLARLGTDYIDLYYAHYDDPSVPLVEAAGAFDALVKAGKVRHIALSNFTPERIDEWFDVAEQHSFVKPIALQPHYNLLAREPFESSYAPLAERHGLGVLPYFSLAAGLLTGKYRNAADVEGADRARQTAKYMNDRTFGVIDTLVEVAASVDAEPTAVALAWLRSKPAVAAPIASARHVGQLDAVLRGATLELPADALARLDSVSEGIAAA
ncbi:aldo/keto reductase [Ruicaihuangia caeni]|uniref:aldo/keto reductase n=1 Tax=Ruicaihuangia caeni TaxID=3042517 RepID=UPI00338F14C4